MKKIWKHLLAILLYVLIVCILPFFIVPYFESQKDAKILTNQHIESFNLLTTLAERQEMTLDEFITVVKEALIEEETEISKIEEKKASIPELTDVVYDYNYTIELQDNLISNSYLYSTSWFDIIRENNKIYLKDDEGSQTFFIELSQEQLTQILNAGYDFDEITLLVKVNKIIPTSTYVYSEIEIDDRLDDIIQDREEPMDSSDVRDYIQEYVNSYTVTSSSSPVFFSCTCEEIVGITTR